MSKVNNCILIDYKKGMDLDNINCFGIILNSDRFSLNPTDYFELDELLKLNKLIKEKGYKTLLNIDSLIKEDEIDEFKEFFNKVWGLFDYYLFSDMGVLTLASDRSKLIYYPKTYIDSFNELNTFKDLGITSVLSNELSIEEIVEIDQNSKDYVIEVFGFHQMFYSRRKLLSLYKDYFKLDFSAKRKEYFIKEELRDDFYPIYEQDGGTLIYTDYCYYLLNELKDLKNYKFIYLNGSFIDLTSYNKIIDIYQRQVNDEASDLEKELQELNYKFDKGFLKQKSILLKGVGRDE